jgi:hypothetical protein
MPRSKTIVLSVKNAKVHKPKSRAKKTASTKGNGVKSSKVFLFALGVVAFGGGAYLVYDKLRKKQVMVYNNTQEIPDIVINNNLPTSSPAQKSVSVRNDNFPLKRGSRGTRVTALQQALAKIIGIETMNANGGIDGQYGPGTANVLKIAGYGETINESTFNAIVNKSDSGSVAINPSVVAQNLYRAAQAKNLANVIASLKQIKSVSDYSSVNDYYKSIPILSKTIVNDLLNYAFVNNETAKEQIKIEFTRIGLKVNDSGVWSLQGIRLYKDLITIRPTVVIDSYNHRITVPRNTILGDEIKIANGTTWFRTVDSGILRVPTQDVKYAN